MHLYDSEGEYNPDLSSRQIRSLHSLNLEMTGKIQLIFIGALLFLVVLSASENSKDDSLTEEGVKARLTRAAKSDSGRMKTQMKKNQ